VAVLALVAGLYHLVNHACFKGLLFLNAGAVMHKTGLRDMDKVGGLAKILPITSIAALVAVLSIGGLPGFSGFVSKWMIYQASIFGGIQYFWTILMGIIAIFISVVTIVSVLKFYSAQFLGKMPEAFKEKAKDHEDWAIWAPQIFLAVLCILLGIIPVLGVWPGFTVFTDMPILSTASYTAVFGEFNLFRIVLHADTQNVGINTVGVWNPFFTIIVFIALGLFGYFITRSAGAEIRTVESWYCGSVIGDEEIIYRSSSYYVYLKEFFKLVNRRFVPGKVEFKTDLSKILNLDTWLYYPFSHGFVSATKWFAKSHVGIPHVYLLWTVIGALITIAVLFWL
ncbi:MAG: hypothetical protein KKE57_02515, partial [Proteobacteria bacterium]|nr:hypothetical protein [Pseudomonadota bacterium]